MLEYINGKVVSCNSGNLILDIGSIAFTIKISTYAEMQFKQNENAKVFVSVFIKDEVIKIFGFIHDEERQLFHKLQNISGVGPAMALNILSGGSPQDLRKAIFSENLIYFKKIKGVGPKTAKRIILELKGTLNSISVSESLRDIKTSNRIDGINALVSLGYNQMIATETVDNIIGKNPEIEINDLIRISLKEMK